MRFTCGLVAIGLMVFAFPASAHHSHGLYLDSFTDLQGVVKEVHLLVPHSFVYIEVGDTIKVRCHALRDGTNGCLLGFLKTKDGSVKDWDGGSLPAPADF
jgi:hypothetical protein